MKKRNIQAKYEAKVNQKMISDGQAILVNKTNVRALLGSSAIQQFTSYNS